MAVPAPVQPQPVPRLQYRTALILPDRKTEIKKYNNVFGEHIANLAIGSCQKIQYPVEGEFQRISVFPI
jgi:hypothetical protein